MSSVDFSAPLPPPLVHAAVSCRSSSSARRCRTGQRSPGSAGPRSAKAWTASPREQLGCLDLRMHKIRFVSAFLSIFRALQNHLFQPKSFSERSILIFLYLHSPASSSAPSSAPFFSDLDEEAICKPILNDALMHLPPPSFRCFIDS